ncbi:MAG: NAD-dependent epimerase/dehydratase family protein [Pelagibacterales bacterium]|nr:NAD-dependent epimerase/dehydratase family protein [Pelagibacterales bacterium]
MKCLVTGGAGFIGSNLVDKLLSLGHQVIVIDNESSDAHERFYWNSGAENYKYDICEFEKIEKLFKGVDIVYHIAAEARIQPAIINPLLAIRSNVLGTCNILQASRKHAVSRVIYSSTSSAYGLKNKAPLSENMKNVCLNPYSVSKVSGEELCKMYTKLYNLETVIFRYFNVYGERQPTKGQYAPVIGLFIKQKSQGLPMTIVGDGLQKRDFTHISDVVRANLAASDLSNKVCVSEVFNVGTGKNHTIIDLTSFLKKDKVVHIPPRLGEARETLADISKIKNLLGWAPKIKLEDWIRKNLK